MNEENNKQNNILEINNKIPDIHKFINITGDPFSDTGGNVIKYLSENIFRDKNIYELLEWITDIYIKNWNYNLHGFFLNSKLVHNSTNKNLNQKRINTLSFFTYLLNNNTGDEDICRITGIKTNAAAGGRDTMVLTGSNTFVNFHPLLTSNLKVSPQIVIRNYFLPFGAIKLSNKYAIVSTNDMDINYYIVKSICEENINRLASNTSKEVFEYEYSRISNALFSFIDKCSMKFSNLDKRNIQMTLYHFTNFGSTPSLEIYNVPSNVFKFYSICLSDRYKSNWKKFLNSYYRVYNKKKKNYNYNPITNKYELDDDSLAEEEFNKSKNIILEKLLNNESILRNFLYYFKKNNFNFEIIKIYQIIIRKMEIKTLDKIEQIADYIISDSDNLKKHISRLEGASKSYVLRNYLLSLIKKYYSTNKNDKPLITLEEYVKYLFPENQYWSEIRDLLLISIYQKLHEKNINIEVDLNQEIINEE